MNKPKTIFFIITLVLTSILLSANTKKVVELIPLKNTKAADVIKVVETLLPG